MGYKKSFGPKVVTQQLRLQNYFRAGTRAAEVAKQKGILALQAERQRRTADALARQARMPSRTRVSLCDVCLYK